MEAAALRQELDGEDRLAVSILGTADPERIARELDEFCRVQLGCGPEECIFWRLSIGAAFGLRFEDGRRVLVKVYGPDRQAGEVRAVRRVQQVLAEHGFPCPRAITSPVPFGKGWAAVDEYVDAGEWVDGHDPEVRRQMAETFARLIELTRACRDLPDLPGSPAPRDALWPKPHNILFDFERTAAKAEWIDRIARRAQEVLADGAGEMVVGHSDWTVQNMRFHGDRISVIYDWDSLKQEREPVLVGWAASTFPMTWYIETHVVPSPEEARAFVAEYETARGAPFTPQERLTLAAAATYSLAYSARCEHAVDDHNGFRQALAGMKGEWYVGL